MAGNDQIQGLINSFGKSPDILETDSNEKSLDVKSRVDAERVLYHTKGNQSIT